LMKAGLAGSSAGRIGVSASRAPSFRAISATHARRGSYASTRLASQSDGQETAQPTVAGGQMMLKNLVANKELRLRFFMLDRHIQLSDGRMTQEPNLCFLHELLNSLGSTRAWLSEKAQVNL
jgi:hypothetical protein